MGTSLTLADACLLLTIKNHAGLQVWLREKLITLRVRPVGYVVVFDLVELKEGVFAINIVSFVNIFYETTLTVALFW